MRLFELLIQNSVRNFQVSDVIARQFWEHAVTEASKDIREMIMAEQADGHYTRNMALLVSELEHLFRKQSWPIAEKTNERKPHIQINQ